MSACDLDRPPRPRGSFSSASTWALKRASGVSPERHRHRRGAPRWAEPPIHVGLVEHVLAALSGLHRHRQLLVELDAPEAAGHGWFRPGFVQAPLRSRHGDASERRPIWADTNPSPTSPGATITLHPPEKLELRISAICSITERESAIPWQIVRKPSHRVDSPASCDQPNLRHRRRSDRPAQQGSARAPVVTDLLVFGRKRPDSQPAALRQRTGAPQDSRHPRRPLPHRLRSSPATSWRIAPAIRTTSNWCGFLALRMQTVLPRQRVAA